MQAPPVSAAVVEAELLRDWGEHFRLPRFTPGDWWECDVFTLSKAGYFYEHEIKISRSDFFADAKKVSQGRGRWVDGKWTHTDRKVKHEELAKGATNGPVHFWFVVPKGMFSESEIPKFAGWMEFEPMPYSKLGRVAFWTRRKAPRLHRTKASKAAVDQANGCCYYRFHRALLVAEGLKRELEASKSRALSIVRGRGPIQAKPAQAKGSHRIFNGGLTAAEALGGAA